jgi:sugar phosphate isomerase/epimerase
VHDTVVSLDGKRLEESAKMVLGYHGYQGQLYNGVSGWDVFFANTPPDVAMQIDTSSCVYHKLDPVEVVRKYPGGSRTIHLKECGGPQFAALGESEISFTALLDACEMVGGTEWYIVEEERGGDSLDPVRRCYEGPRKLGRV